MQLQQESIALIPESDAEVLHPAVLTVGAGQHELCFLLLLRLRYLKGIVEKVRGEAAVRMYNLQKRLPDVTLPVSRHLQTDVLESEILMGSIIVIRIAARKRMLLAQRRRVPETDFSPIVQMFRVSGFHDFKQIGCVFCLQTECAVFFGNHKRPPFP